MKDIGKLRPESICVQGGYQPENGQARVLPIVQSTTYKYDDADEVATLFDLAKEGHMYSRISNPTVGALEEKVAQLEGGVGALATASGQAANLIAVLTLAQAGENIVAMNNIYGGTFTLLGSTLEKFGIKTKFIPLNDFEALEEAIDQDTKLVFGETIGNPGVQVLDIEGAAEIAHKNGIPLVVDNTFATPFLCRPIDFGADIVTHSATKYMDGHATSLGGIIVDSGKFDWTSGKFPCLVDQDPNYHGLSYTQAFKEAAYITKARAVFIRDLGATMSPFNAFLINLGIETLALRMERHSQNALAVAKFLEDHPGVEWVHYPHLESSPSYDLAKKYLPKGGSGVISFGVLGDVEDTKSWINNLDMISLVVHVADVRSHALHPASMTHRQLSEEALKEAGVLPNMVRLSVGIEDLGDIIQDLDRAFKKL